jgi:hypothetical protein
MLRGRSAPRYQCLTVMNKLNGNRRKTSRVMPYDAPSEWRWLALDFAWRRYSDCWDSRLQVAAGIESIFEAANLIKAECAWPDPE